MKISKTVTTLSIVLGIVLVGSVAAVAATSVSEGANGRISGCYSSNGTLFVVSPGTSCGTRKSISWVGHNLQATVQPSWAFGNSYGVNSVSHKAGSGTYVMTMQGTLTNCADTASLAFVPGDISIEQINSTQIEVQTYTTSGTAADRTFQFIVSCP
jgi:hypothetical protein